jgi:hypothetical protein
MLGIGASLGELIVFVYLSGEPPRQAFSTVLHHQ